GDAIDGTIGAVVEEHNPVASLAFGEWLAPAGRDGTVTDDRLRRSIGGDRTNRPTLDVRDRRRLPGLRGPPAGGADGAGTDRLPEGVRANEVRLSPVGRDQEQSRAFRADPPERQALPIGRPLRPAVVRIGRDGDRADAVIDVDARR